MIPSLAAWGGMSGLLGLREIELGADETVATLNQGYQRHPDTCWVDYANLMREPGGKPKPPIARSVDKTRPPQSTVALVGGGIGNIIAAYELSRVGVRCTLFEATDRLGGRLRTLDPSTTLQFSELGAMKFPRGGLMWHYVAQWVRSTNKDPEDIGVAPFPHAGTVPTMVTYQGKTYEWTPSLSRLPPVFGEAKALFTDYFRGLNDGAPDPRTIYFPEVQGALRSAPSDATTSTVRQFWKVMIRRFDGRSFGEVLQTEVFARGSDAPDLLATFGTLGLGTGGFGPMYEVAFLEVLRRLLWDTSDEFSLPDANDYPHLYSLGRGGAAGFADRLARAALAEVQAFHPKTTFDSMFKLNSPVTQVFDHSQARTVEVALADGTKQSFGYAIVGMSSRAMQAIGVDLSYPDAPLVSARDAPGTSPDLVRPSVSAAVRRLTMMSAYKMYATIAAPERVKDWPVDSGDREVLCFLTDQAARAAYVLPPDPKGADVTDALVCDAWGADAIKLESMSTKQRADLVAASFAFGVLPNGDGGPAPTIELSYALTATSSTRDLEWNAQTYVGGGVKLDKPCDNYFSDSLFFHYTVADPTSDAAPSAVYFCGDSVGHLGGWVEGAAMSAVNAVTAVCTRIQIREGSPFLVEDRFEKLLSPRTMLFHQWQSVGGKPPSMTGLHTMTRLGNHQENPALPATWRNDGILDDREYYALSVSKRDDFIVTTDRRRDVFFWEKDDDGLWSVRDTVEFDGIESTTVAVATDGAGAEERLTQLIVVDDDWRLWHRTRQHGTWSPPAQPWPGLEARKASLDVESWAAQVVVVDDGWRLLHGIRYPDRWSALNYVEGPRGENMFDVSSADVGCTDLTWDLTTVAAVSRVLKCVCVTVRDGKAGGTWRPWVRLPSPLLPGIDEPMTPVTVRVVVLDANNAQILAEFADGQVGTPYRLYSSVRNTVADPSGQTWTTFRPVPYPYSNRAGLREFAPAWDTDPYRLPLSTKNYRLISGN